MSPFLFVQKSAVAVGALLLSLGLMVMVWDGLFIWKFGVDYNDAAFVTAGNEVAEYGSAEQPLYARFPLFAYSFPIWFIAAMLRLWIRKEEQIVRM